MKDIYDGDLVHVWEDEDMVFISFPWATINIPGEEWGKILADLKNLVVAARETELKEMKELFDERKN